MLERIKTFWGGYARLEVVLLHLVLLLPLLFVLLLSAVFSVDNLESREGIIALTPRCAFKALTDKPCFTCGLSRAFAAISHGDFERATYYRRDAFIWYGAFVFMIIMLSISLFIYLILLEEPEESS